MKVRISKAHVRIYRAIEGAVRNAADGHPTWSIPRDFGRSVAKRATGTLTADWPDVLAAHNEPSEASSPGRTPDCWPPRRGYRHGRAKGERCYVARRSPLRLLWNEISAIVGPARRAGDTARADALIEVLRIIDRRIKPR